MNTIVQSLVLAHAEQTTVQATVGCINDGAKPKGNARPDSNYSKRTMNMRIIHDKMRIRSPEYDIKYLERLSETFIGGTVKCVMAGTCLRVQVWQQVQDTSEGPLKK